MPSHASLDPTATLSEDTQTDRELQSGAVEDWTEQRGGQTSLSCLTVWQLSILPPPQSTWRRDIFIVFYLMSGSGLGFRLTACGALPLSFLERNPIAFSCL